MTEKKTSQTDKSVLAFIDVLPTASKKEDAIKILELLRKITKEEPRMWGSSIIGFGSYTYQLANGKESTYARMSYSPRKTNLVFYVLSNFEDQDTLLKKLGKHRTGKICLYINKLADVDMKVLTTILKKAWHHSKNNPGC